MKSMKRGAILLAGLMTVGSIIGTAHAQTKTKRGGKMRVYIGTYTKKQKQGIFIFDMDTKTGQLTPSVAGPETPNPTFLTIHPNGKFLYAVNEIDDFEGKKAGSVSAYSIAADGSLSLLNQQSSVGDGPCYITLDPSKKHALIANYGGGSVAVLPVESDGKIGTATAFVQHIGSSVNKDRQGEPHAHSLNPDATGKYAFAADLGTDKIYIYNLDSAKGTLTPHSPPALNTKPGAGPRHFTFAPDYKHAYYCGELDSTVNVASYDAQTATLTNIQTLSTLPADYHEPGNSTAEVRVHPNGKFVYVSNRGHNSLAIFAVQPDGTLKAAGHQSVMGKTPRNFNFDPSGTFLLAANQDSDNLVVFRLDGQTGKMTEVMQVSVPMPVCIKFLPLK